MTGPNPNLIGATDIAAILGVHPYKSACDVYLRIVEGIDQPQNEAMEWGLRLEEVVAQAFAERYSLSLSKGATVERPHGREWQRISPDYRVVDSAAEIVECKTSNVFAAKRFGQPDTDEIPDEYLIQCTTYLEALRAERAWVPVLVGGQQLRRYRVDYDPELGAIAVDAGARFWRDHILPKRMPAPQPSAAFSEYLKRKHPINSKPERHATSEETELLHMYRTAKESADKAVVRLDGLDAQLRLAVGDHDGLRWEGGRLTYRLTKGTTTTDWKAVAGGLREYVTENLWREAVAAETKHKEGVRRLVVRFD